MINKILKEKELCITFDDLIKYQNDVTLPISDEFKIIR
jgi:hypothetical protein